LLWNQYQKLILHDFEKNSDQTTIDDRPRHKHQFGTLPYKEVLRCIINGTKNIKKKRVKTGDQGAPLDSKNLLHQNFLAVLVFGWTKGITWVYRAATLSFVAEIVLDECTKAYKGLSMG
jgi:hypothetical protein